MRKKQYSNPAPVPVPIVAPEPLPYAFDLKSAAKYVGFSVWSLRQAIYAGHLAVVANKKPHVVRRSDLEAFVDSRVHRGQS